MNNLQAKQGKPETSKCHLQPIYGITSQVGMSIDVTGPWAHPQSRLVHPYAGTTESTVEPHYMHGLFMYRTRLVRNSKIPSFNDYFSGVFEAGEIQRQGVGLPGKFLAQQQAHKLARHSCFPFWYLDPLILTPQGFDPQENCTKIENLTQKFRFGEIGQYCNGWILDIPIRKPHNNKTYLPMQEFKVFRSRQDMAISEQNMKNSTGLCENLFIDHGRTCEKHPPDERLKV